MWSYLVVIGSCWHWWWHWRRRHCPWNPGRWRHGHFGGHSWWRQRHNNWPLFRTRRSGLPRSVGPFSQVRGRRGPRLVSRFLPACRRLGMRLVRVFFFGLWRPLPLGVWCRTSRLNSSLIAFFPSDLDLAGSGRLDFSLIGWSLHPFSPAFWSACLTCC